MRLIDIGWLLVGCSECRRCLRLPHRVLATFTLRYSRSYQLLAGRGSPGLVRRRIRASTATQPSGRAMTGLRSSSATSGRSTASSESRWTRSTSAAASAAAAPRKPHELPRLAPVHELVRVEVGQRRDPEPGPADQLGEHSAGAEGDERAEDRVLDHPGEQLGAALDHRLHEQRTADALGRGADSSSSRGSARHRRSRSCARRPRRS